MQINSRTVICVVLLFATFSEAQLTSASASGSRVEPTAPKAQGPLSRFEQFAVYWTEEPGWHTELQLRNNLASGDLTVTPSVRSADGTEVRLLSVTIKPGTVLEADSSASLPFDAVSTA